MKSIYNNSHESSVEFIKTKNDLQLLVKKTDFDKCIVSLNSKIIVFIQKFEAHLLQLKKVNKIVKISET